MSDRESTPTQNARAQSNVDYIVQALADTPEDHAWEVNEERLTIEYGERVAGDMAAGDALGYGLGYFSIFAALRYRGRPRV